MKRQRARARYGGHAHENLNGGDRNSLKNLVIDALAWRGTSFQHAGRKLGFERTGGGVPPESPKIVGADPMCVKVHPFGLEAERRTPKSTTRVEKSLK